MGMYDMKNLMAAIKSSNLAVAVKINDEALKNQLNDLHERVAQTMQEYQIESGKVGTDTNLSQVGKQEKRRELMTTALDQLETLGTSKGTYKQEADRLVEKADVDELSDNPVVDYLMQREIRDKIGPVKNFV